MGLVKTYREADSLLFSLSADTIILNKKEKIFQNETTEDKIAIVLEGMVYLCMEDGEILGVFYYAEENDPTYDVIYDGAWQNDKPYAVIHRIAVSRDSHGKGVAAFIFDSCFARFPNLKIDTHRDNLPMQRALEKRGFVRCGIIHLANGDERIAFQRVS